MSSKNIERHDGHPPETICRPAGNGLCEPLGDRIACGCTQAPWLPACPHNPRDISSKVPDLRGVPLGVLPAPGGDEGPAFSSGI